MEDGVFEHIICSAAFRECKGALESFTLWPCARPGRWPWKMPASQTLLLGMLRAGFSPSTTCCTVAPSPHGGAPVRPEFISFRFAILVITTVLLLCWTRPSVVGGIYF